MRVIGLLRVKNEARWIGEVVDAMFPLCARVYLMDDSSTDNTREIAAEHGAVVLRSPFTDLAEGRDKNWLLEQIAHERPDWCLMVDGDEVLEAGAQEKLLAAMQDPKVSALRLPIVYLWNDRQHYRVDGASYQRFLKAGRPSAFRWREGLSFTVGAGAGFHCSNVPLASFTQTERNSIANSGARLLHLGYLHREDRVRKFHWYNERDPNNRAEDGYRHMILGDLPEYPATMTCRWGGPLQLEAL